MNMKEQISLLEYEAKNCGIPCDIPHFNQVIYPAPPRKSREETRKNFHDIEEKSLSLEQEIAYLKATSCVAAYRPIFSCRPVIGPIIVFFKRVVRKLTKFYVEPITLDQSDRNAHIAHALELIQVQLKAQQEEIERLKQERT